MNHSPWLYVLPAGKGLHRRRLQAGQREPAECGGGSAGGWRTPCHGSQEIHPQNVAGTYRAVFRIQFQFRIRSGSIVWPKKRRKRKLILKMWRVQSGVREPVPRLDPDLRVLNLLFSSFNWFLPAFPRVEEGGGVGTLWSGSNFFVAKMTHEKRKSGKNFVFWRLDVLVGGLDPCSLAWKSFLEA